MNDIWITHYSLSSWALPDAWDDYFHAIEAILNDRLLKLDDVDPIRRKADTTKGEGSFVVKYGEHESSRWVRGKFDRTKVEIEVQHYKSGHDSFGRARENRLTIYIPERLASVLGSRQLVELFRLGNEHWGAFYAYADFKTVVCAKKPSTPSLDISSELLGVFWLTYFGSRYCDFFDRSRLLNLHEATLESGGGVTIRLADIPGQVGLESRATMERELGELSFAGYGLLKSPGQYALALADLRGAPSS